MSKKDLFDDIDITIVFKISHSLTDALREIYKESDVEFKDLAEFMETVKEGLLNDITQQIFHFSKNPDLIQNYITYEVD